MLLGPRKKQVLSLIAKGSTNNQIAAAMGISLGTVRRHVKELTKAGLLKYDEVTSRRKILVDLRTIVEYKVGQCCPSALSK